jgi:hypothetical protein
MPGKSKKKSPQRKKSAQDDVTARDLELARAAVEQELVSAGAFRRARRAQRALAELGYVFRIGELMVRRGDVALEDWLAFTAGIEAAGIQAGAPAALTEPAAEEPVTPEAEDAEEQAIVSALCESDHCMTGGEIAGILHQSQRHTSTTLANLVDNGTLEVGKQGRVKLYWHPQRPFYPEWGLTGPVTAARLAIDEDAALERAARQLRSTLFVFEAEQITHHELTWLPLWRVDLHGSFSDGLVFKKSRRRSGTLYFHGSRGTLCSLVPDQGLRFGAFAGEAPDSIQDLDELCEWEERLPAELELNPRVMDALKPADTVEKALTTRHGMTVDALELVFLPCWKLTLASRSDPLRDQRLLVLDGVAGLPVEL